MKKYFLYLCVIIALGACQTPIPDELKAEYAILPEKLDYNLDVKPILSDKCFACHGPDKAKQKAGLRLDMAESAFAPLPENPQKVAIAPGDLAHSEVFRRIMSKDPDLQMPTPESHLTLTNYEKAVLVKWIQDGAEYQPHWAFEKIKLPKVPRVKGKDWVKNEIDHFVLAKLEALKAKPQLEADKETLLRRIHLDLTGLPPTLADMEAFLADRSPDAYEKVVNKLLDSPHFGEKMATDWMDVARFADSHGYTVDRLRDMTPYRDWVIKAFNQNLPYDQFIHWQMAGDLLKNPTRDQRIATAFNRIHQQNMEGGIVEEEFRVEYVADRTNTLGTAFLGLSVECAKCHDHKYDPITQKNYYELFSFFNNVNEAGQISWDDAMPVPTLQLPTPEQEKVIRYIQTQLTQTLQSKQHLPKIEVEFEKWLSTGQYRKDLLAPDPSLIASYSFDNNLQNTINKTKGIMRREVGNNDDLPQFVAGAKGQALQLEGDVWMDTENIGAFRRYEPFTIGLWIYVPKDLKEGVIFHRGVSGLLYNFRGYHLQLKNHKLEFTLARTAPDNAITIHSKMPLPKEKWQHIAVSYDGSSMAKGIQIYINGQKISTDVQSDNLTKDIAFFERIYKKQPALQLGAWGRGLGFKNGKIDELKVYNRQLSAHEIAVMALQNDWKSVLSKEPQNLTETERKTLREYFVAAKSPTARLWRSEIMALRKAHNDSIEAVREIMVMKEMPTPRQAYVLNRGNYDSYGEKVFPNTPEAILKWDGRLPKNRLGLAHWLTHPDNPLTARVTVNRYWQMMFGVGIVRTSNDFGNQGELPSHRELLDYLAADFLKNGWNIKALLRKIALSAAYRQSSRASRAWLAQDPDNRLLARGPSQRLSAEMIRDNALAASGLLKPTIGGASIKPYQPEGLWAINGDKYVADTTDDIYKRSLYIVVKRTVPHPTLSTFDAPARNACTVRRQNTSTPLQALVLLNDPTYIETCKVMAETLLKEGNTPDALIRVFRKITGRKPIKKELELLLTQQKATYEKFRSNPSKSDAWVKMGLYKIDPRLDKNWVAANTIVVNTILNSDASITKR
ncbi:MAG: DUF1553 domain-containing protein [Runella sp.]